VCFFCFHELQFLQQQPPIFLQMNPSIRRGRHNPLPAMDSHRRPRIIRRSRHHPPLMDSPRPKASHQWRRVIRRTKCKKNLSIRRGRPLVNGLYLMESRLRRRIIHRMNGLEGPDAVRERGTRPKSLVSYRWLFQNRLTLAHCSVS
jgi:hypothetical protein